MVQESNFLKNMCKMGQIWHFNPTYLYITIIYMSKLQFLCLNKTCRMIGCSVLSNNVNHVQIGFEWL